jgi:hypothetical protein
MRRRTLETEGAPEDVYQETSLETLESLAPMVCDRCEKEAAEDRWEVVCSRCAAGVSGGDPDSIDPEPFGCALCERQDVPARDTRVVCYDCLGIIRRRPGPQALPPLDLRANRERDLPERELRRRVSKGRCSDLCGRELPPGSRSPRCRDCLRIHKRELARRRQLKRRSKVRDKSPDEPDNRHTATERAPAHGHGEERGGRGDVGDKKGPSIRSRGLRAQTPSPNTEVNLTSRHSTYGRRVHAVEANRGLTGTGERPVLGGKPLEVAHVSPRPENPRRPGRCSRPEWASPRQPGCARMHRDGVVDGGLVSEALAARTGNALRTSAPLGTDAGGHAYCPVTLSALLTGNLNLPPVNYHPR